ncbi:IS5 family transposase [Baaleninema simplex]|uniref:IS5 family transposase n=1 Tax=Baaleninema simplex TaxID=2862350 RepID=UPI0003460344|nr:IS5 family transposase [Baaleninema simplex]
MYRKSQNPDTPEEAFELSSEEKLCGENRWVILAKLIPWTEFEEEYAQIFSEEMGAPAKPFRMALGALIIKEKLGISDRETVEQIRENPYLQYFIGQKSYSSEAPFDPSMMVHFRQRIGEEFLGRINKSMVKKAQGFGKEATEKKLGEAGEREDGQNNKGKLLIDATVAPADIKYPTDFDLLNSVRKDTERIVDKMHEQQKVKGEKRPRTYRKQARKEYLKFSKRKKKSRKERINAVKKQLKYVKRNLEYIEKLIETGVSLECLSHRQYRRLLVGVEIYRQQQWMLENQTERIDDRIVSLSQPHVRPIVRGKARANTEFGAKISVSCWDGYVFVERISWDNYNETGDLKMQVEEYKELTGHYPKSVHADRIYRTRANRAWCKERGIRLSGPPLGRPPKKVSKEQKRQEREDERVRNEIEGKFGQGKRRFGLGRVMTKLAQTSETSISLTFLVMNLVKLLRQFYCLFLCQISQNSDFVFQIIRMSYIKLFYTKKIAYA